MRILLGGYPGAGKTHLSLYLEDLGWNRIGMDGCGSSKTPELLDAPPGHPAFAAEPLVVEGGFLAKAPQFQDLVNRHGLRTFWLTGTFKQLRDSRLKRNAKWDDTASIYGGKWVPLVERYAKDVRWDHTIPMWHEDGTRKEPAEVLGTILDLWYHGIYPSSRGRMTR